MIVEQACPRCANRRTVRMRQWGSFCFNCRLRWNGASAAATPRSQVVSIEAANRQGQAVASHAFATEELRRLEVYRLAVRHGFFSDWPG